MKGGMEMKEKKQLKLSYESDGKMGEQQKEKNNKKEQKDFFNTTPSSE
jgi:hypothetical protein